jgi:cathepsin L
LLFAQRLKDAVAHNAQPGHTSSLGVNDFTDQASPPKGRRADPHAAKQRTPTGAAPSPGDAARQAAFELLLASPAALPSAVDWRQHVPAVVSAVKNQGHCGSCWAFATTAVVESAVALASGELFALSPQQLVACAPNEGHCGGFGGCMGSVSQLAFDYLIGSGGYAEEWSFPYVSYAGATNGTCLPLNDAAQNVPVQAGITGYATLDANNASAVMAAVATIGPLVVNVDASQWGSYSGGVFDGCGYDNMDLDHLVTLVGYGTDEILGDYWLVRNS